MGCSSAKSFPETFIPSVNSGIVPQGKNVARGGTEGNFHQNYFLGKKIGEGAFSKVYVAHEVSHEEPSALAVKILDQRIWVDGEPIDKVDSEMLRSVKRELLTLQVVSQFDCCTRLVESFLFGQFAYVVMEKCDRGMLRHLELMPVLSEVSLLDLLQQMISAIRCIHSVSVVHRDIKPDNFLVRNGTVKLCDFGMAANLQTQSSHLTGIHGTAPYMSPEILSLQKCGLATDVWSFGVTAYVLFLGKFPYMPVQRSCKAMKVAIVVGKPEPDFKCHMGVPEVSLAVEGLLRQILVRCPSQRPSATEAQRAFNELSSKQNNENSQCSTHSLRPALAAARRAGAFMVPNLQNSSTSLDQHVQQLQAKYHGSSVPSTVIKSKAKSGSRGFS